MGGYRDLMLHLACGDDDGVPERISYAAALAARCGAHLTGLFTRPPLPLASHYVPATVVAEHRAAAELAAATGRRLFEENLVRHGISGEWIESEGASKTAIQQYGRCMDLVILRQAEAPLDDMRSRSEYGGAQLPQDLVFALGRPVIRLPRKTELPQQADHLLIGWNGKKEAARAVHDAMPLLCRAASVTVLCVDAENLDGTPGSDLARHLARHDVIVDLVVSAQRDGDAGAILLQIAEERKVDLIVMGAYGYMRWRERIFGGATETVLGGASLPVLFSH